MGHGGEFWQNMVHWRREWQTTSVFLPWEPHEQCEKAKRWDTERWTPQVVKCPICYWRSVENSLQKDWKDRHKAKTTPSCGHDWRWSCKEQCCIGAWKVSSINQGKLEVIKHEMARVNIDILGISKLKCTWMGDDHYIYYRGQESLRRNGVDITVNKTVQNELLCNLKNDRLISVRFQSKPFNITVI